jgi:hypothetical protein
MAKVLNFRVVNTDTENRIKDFEKMRSKLKVNIKKEAAKKTSTGKESKGLLKSISVFFADSPKTPAKNVVKI